MSNPGTSDRPDSERPVPRYPPPQYPPPNPSQVGMPPPPPGAAPQGQGYYQPAPSFQPAPTYQPAAVSTPNPHWVLSIVALLLSWVFGAVALYFSYQVGERARVGNLPGAEQASKLARLWGWIGIGAGVLIIVIYLGATDYSSSY